MSATQMEGAEKATAQPKAERLLSLDTLRGLTIAGMILVNNPGSWKYVWGPLGHAEWDGWTPTDLIFPFFLFMVGVAMTYSFDKRLAQGASRRALLGHVVCRAIVLFLLGMILTGFPNLRLITPYILGIIGLEILLERPSRKPGEPIGALLPIAIVCLVVAVGWFVVDFHYFHSPTTRSRWSDIFPLAPDPQNGSYIRIPGVLQRIALCYVAAALIMMLTRNVRARIAWILALISIYWVVMTFCDAPAGYQIGAGAKDIVVDAPPTAYYTGRLNDWIDTSLLNGHLYKHRPDPEGLLSTIPAIATTLIGVLAGTWLRSNRSQHEKVAGLMVAGFALLILGSIFDLFFPINKKIWTSSYVVFTGGWALLCLGFCYYVIDVQGWRRWATPFLVFGTNAITAFFASGLLARIIGMIRWKVQDGTETNLKAFTFDALHRLVVHPYWASHLWALGFVVLWFLLLLPLYRRRIFIRV